MTDDIVQRILARTIEEGECLLWQGRVANGSALVHILGQGYRSARRLIWEHKYGQPMPAHLRATCRCGEPRCVRPEHVTALSLKQIGKRAAKAGKFRSIARRSAIAAAQRARSRLTPELVAQIREAPSGAGIARELGIHKSTASKIRRGESWRPVLNSVWSFMP